MLIFIVMLVSTVNYYQIRKAQIQHNYYNMMRLGGYISNYSEDLDGLMKKENESFNYHHHQLNKWNLVAYELVSNLQLIKMPINSKERKLNELTRAISEVTNLISSIESSSNISYNKRNESLDGLALDLEMQAFLQAIVIHLNDFGELISDTIIFDPKQGRYNLEADYFEEVILRAENVNLLYKTQLIQ
ncbi:hypothetical protein [Alkaliphilus transvaalensis]|uniref:hypothetical protein n=1 Tax=Alkaliphilus transvaalensis TaxID=114628 RepID=UPI0012EBFB2A|nr:hypothetical protein [Alkaliphilus transvaalensis]